MSQKENILRHLKVYGSITPYEALNQYGSLRLGAIIFNLKEEGHKIRTEINRIGKHYAIYHLEVSNER